MQASWVQRDSLNLIHSAVQVTKHWKMINEPNGFIVMKRKWFSAYWEDSIERLQNLLSRIMRELQLVPLVTLTASSSWEINDD